MINADYPYPRKALRKVALRIKSMWPQHRYAMLWFNVVENAINDLNASTSHTPVGLEKREGVKISASRARKARQDAADFLNGQMFACEVCGVRSEYVHRILKDLEGTQHEIISIKKAANNA